MPADDVKFGDRQRFAEIKKSMANLSSAERVAQEVRLARENGLTVSASEAAAIGRPIERRMRLEPEPVLHATAEVLVAGHDGGQSADLDVRQSMSEILRTSAFMPAAQAGLVREALKGLRAGANLDALVTRLDPQLELMAAHGENADLIREAKAAFAQTIFASADPLKSRKGVGGEPST